MDDPFQAHALFALQFVCERCQRVLQNGSAAEIGSDDFCKRLADDARREGWFCPQAQKDGTMHVMFSLCPDCAKYAEEELAKTKWKGLR